MDSSVSIPFKREGLSEQVQMIPAVAATPEFQFPSNGKVFLNRWQYKADTEDVSEFQFPSNGKVFLNGNGKHSD